MKNVEKQSKLQIYKKNSISKKRNYSPSQNNKKKLNISFNRTLSRKDINQKIIKKNINKELLNDNYLEFIIHEKIKYADVDKICDYYSEKINSKIKIYNDNEILIKSKKKELKQLNLAMYSELVKNFKFDNPYTSEEYCDKEIEEAQKDIRHKEHQIEIFQEIYNQSYKLNFKLNKKLDKESVYGKVYDEQYQRYNDIFTNSISKMKRQEDKLNELKEDFKRCKIINNSLISEKVQKINKLEYEIEMIKNNVANYLDNLEKLKEKNVHFQEALNKCKNIYNIRKNEYKDLSKTYLKEYFKMFEIYEIFKVDDFEQILSEFKKIKKKYNELSLRFHGYSKEIMKLSMELKKNENILLDTKEKIKQKVKKANIDLKRLNIEKYDLINTQKNELASVNMEIYNECKNREDLMNIYINFLLNIIHRIINSLKNSLNNSPFSKIKKFETIYTNYFNKDFTSVNINYMENLRDPKFLLFIISLFKKVKILIYEIIINVFCNIYNNINNEQNPQNIEEQEQEIEENEDNDIFVITGLNSELVHKEYLRQLKLSIQQLKLKKKIYSRNKDDIFNSKNNNDKTISSANSNKKMYYSISAELLNLGENQMIYNRRRNFVSPKEFYKDYLDYCKKKGEINMNDFSTINKQIFINKYTNDLVTEQKNIEKIKNEKIKKRIETTKAIKEKLDELELNKFLKKKKNKIILQQINKKTKKSDEDDEEEEENIVYKRKLSMIKKELEESKKPKKFKIKLSNTENERISVRYEDIRMLEYNYIKNYSNFSVDPNIFNEYFYNVKKKFIQMNKNMNKSLEINNSSNSRNKVTIKKLLKNYSLILPKIDKKEKTQKRIFNFINDRKNVSSLKHKFNSISP